MYRDIPCAQPDSSRTHKYQNEYEARSLLSRSEHDKGSLVSSPSDNGGSYIR
jgi:hypothetical protein